MEGAVYGIIWLCVIYWLDTGKWPEDTPELRQAITETLDKAEENGN